jgi:hypothetical protein
MRTRFQALIWEMWRLSRGDLLLILGGQFFFMLCLYFLSYRAENADEPATRLSCGIFVMLSMGMSLFSTAWLNALDNLHTGFSFRLGFSRPISTAQLVAVPMLFAAVVSPICYLLPAIAFRLLMGVQIPLVGPAMLIACVVVCLVSVAWSPTTIVGRSIGLLAFISALVAALIAMHSQRAHLDPFLLEIGMLGFFDFAWPDYLAMFMVATGALGITVMSVERQRHGERWRIESLSRWWRGLSITLPRRQQPFPSPLSAQCWYEMRGFGVAILILGALSTSILFVIVAVKSHLSPDWVGAPWIWLFAFVLFPLWYQMVGVEGASGLRWKQGAVKLPAFFATKPLRNDDMIAIKLLVIASFSFVGSLSTVLAAAAHVLIVGDWPLWKQAAHTIWPSAAEIPVHWWIAGLACAMFLLISSTSIALAFRLWFPLHRGLFVCVLFALALHFLLALVESKSDWSLRYLWIGYGWGLTVAIIVGSVLAVRTALTSGFLGKRLFAWSLCLWAIYASTAVAMFIKLAPQLSVPFTLIVLGFASLLIPLASAAIAPLALALHRHG